MEPGITGTNPQARHTIRDTKELGNRPLSRGRHFVLGDLKSFVYARLASFSLRG